MDQLIEKFIGNIPLEITVALIIFLAYLTLRYLIFRRPISNKEFERYFLYFIFSFFIFFAIFLFIKG